jgi:hypothetical protein
MYAKNLFSLDMYYGSAAGLYPRTAGVNDLGNPVRDAVADGGELYCQALQQMVVLTQRGLLLHLIVL